MKWLLGLSTVALGCALSTAPALAGGDNTMASILLHAKPVVSKNVCEFGKPASCGEILTAANSGAFYNVYLLVTNGSDSTGIAGLQCGVTYNGTPGQGVDIYNWTLCAALQFSDDTWPSPGSGDLMTWNGLSTDPVTGCQMLPAVAHGVTAVVGYFYVGVYSPDRMTVTNRPVDNRAKVVSCNNVEDDITGLIPSHLGYVDFGGGAGYNPCGYPISARVLSWGSIKALYR